MFRLALAIAILALGLTAAAGAQGRYEKDVIPTSQGDLEITFLGHASLMMAFGGKTIHVDPCGDVADYRALPRADLVLVTHEHFDHFDPAAFRAIVKPGTAVIGSKGCSGKLPSGAVLMANGESRTVLGLLLEAIPAYNIEHKRPDGNPFHPQGSGNGYVVTFGDKRIYIAGDTENTPAMKALAGIDVAFLPMNLPYTMSPEQVADAALAFKPKALYPYHCGDTDTGRLVKLLSSEEGIEVRIRKMR
jgi:L-ascorbate metabolism protein UlaG (beta-lactamase superfamily)